MMMMTMMTLIVKDAVAAITCFHDAATKNIFNQFYPCLTVSTSD